MHPFVSFLVFDPQRWINAFALLRPDGAEIWNFGHIIKARLLRVSTKGLLEGIPMFPTQALIPLTWRRCG